MAVAEHLEILHTGIWDASEGLLSEPVSLLALLHQRVGRL